MEKILSPNLKSIYSEIQYNSNDFKNEVFLKNFQHLTNNIGTIDKIKRYHTVGDEKFKKYLKNEKNYKDLIIEFSEKAKKY